MGGIGECQTALETSEANVGGRFLYHTWVCQHNNERQENKSIASGRGM
jgi:hypothetical protein